MKVLENGTLREATEEEVVIYNQPYEFLSYKDRVINKIRERYSIDDEIAILRQKEIKPDEWAEYNLFVENIKFEEKLKTDMSV